MGIGHGSAVDGAATGEVAWPRRPPRWGKAVPHPQGMEVRVETRRAARVLSEPSARPPRAAAAAVSGEPTGRRRQQHDNRNNQSHFPNNHKLERL